MADKDKTMLDHGKLQMQSRKLDNGEYPPKFKVQTFNNNPQFAVFSGVPSAKRSGVISAGMDPVTLQSVFLLIERMIELDPNGETLIYEIENEQGRGKDKKVTTKTVIGKDPDGIMFISVVDVDPEMPKVRFDFNTDYYHKIIGPGLDKAELSKIAAQSWVNNFRQMLPIILVNDYAPVVYNGGRGGSNSNSNSSSSSSGGSGNTPW